jgi:hypothetical protein
MSNPDDFDDVGVDQESKMDRIKNLATERSGDSLGRALSIFPCFPKYVPKPDTPSIDKVK